MKFSSIKEKIAFEVMDHDRRSEKPATNKKNGAEKSSRAIEGKKNMA